MLRLLLFIGRVPNRREYLVSDKFFEGSELVTFDKVLSLMKMDVKLLTYPITSDKIKEIIWAL